MADGVDITSRDLPPSYNEAMTSCLEPSPPTYTDTLLPLLPPPPYTDLQAVCLVVDDVTVCGLQSNPTSCQSSSSCYCHQHRLLFIVVLCVAVLCNPLFGFVALLVSRDADDKSSYNSTNGFPSNNKHRTYCVYNKMSLGISVVGLVVTSVIVISVVAVYKEQIMAQTSSSNIYTCQSRQYNNISYPFCVRSTASQCAFGFYMHQSCYYDSRYESSRHKQLGVRTCVSPMADLAADGYCYFSSSKLACPFSRNYNNGICYTFGVRLSFDECIHGYYTSGFCYYETMYRTKERVCRENNADMFDNGYCLGSLPRSCQYTQMYVNGVCYKYRLKHLTDPQQCRNDGGLFHQTYCYYTTVKLPELTQLRAVR
jgi:hypothetical protein